MDSMTFTTKYIFSRPSTTHRPHPSSTYGTSTSETTNDEDITDIIHSLDMQPNTIQAFKMMTKRYKDDHTQPQINEHTATINVTIKLLGGIARKYK